MKSSALFLFLLFAVSACSNTGKSLQDFVTQDVSDEYMEEHLPEEVTVEHLRTKLSDAYSLRTNEIPAAFAKIKTVTEEITNPDEGFRIQIYSGQQVSQADTIAARFRAWADTTITGYQPETYIFFRTPYYRVHVGDFHNRDKAISFSNLVKRAFRDAWVVHDRVEPANVPSDTIQIKIKNTEKPEGEN